MSANNTSNCSSTAMTFPVVLFCAQGEIQSSTHRRSSINHGKRTKTLQSVG